MYSDINKITSSKYSQNDWHFHNKNQFIITKNEGMSAEKFIEKSCRTQDRVQELIIKTKKETEWLLRGRIKDIEFRRIELEEKRKSLQEEIEILDIFQKRISDEIKCINKDAGEVVQKCIDFRLKRMGIDLIRDEVERELEIERKKITESGELLAKALEQVKESKRDLRASLYLLNKDVKDKISSIAIEIECLNLKEHDQNLLFDDKESLNNANISVDEWALYSQEIIKTSDKKIRDARLLEGKVNILLKDIICDLKEQYYYVNELFQKRVEDVKEAKRNLEGQLYEIAGQVNDMNLHISTLLKSIQEKECFLALARTRLTKRMERPGVELVKDNIEASLIKEISGIEESVLKLQKMYAEAEICLRRLLETQLHLEEEINIKNNSIKIDEVDCLTIREKINYEFF